MSAQHQDIAKVVAGAAVGAGILAAVRNLSKYSPPKVWKESEIRTDHGSNTSTSGAQYVHVPAVPCSALLKRGTY